MKNFRKRAPAVILAVVLAACVSAPRTLDPLLEPRIPLDEGAMAYVFVDVPGARSILDHINIEGYNSSQVEDILDRTRLAVAALYSPESGRGIRAVTWGTYPSTRAGLAFTMSKDWKRRRSSAGKSYWYAPAYGLSLALSSTQAFAAVAPSTVRGPTVPGTGGPTAREVWEAAELPAGPFVQGPGIEVPEGFNTFRQGTSLALWMDRPAETLERFLSALRIPLRIPAEQLMAGFLALPPADGATDTETLHELKLRIKVSSEASARTMMTLLSTVRLFIVRSGTQGSLDPETLELLSLLFSRPPEQEGVYLTLRSPPLDEEGIALLFTLFSVYSQ
ncbi:MAG: hypothetical protein LBF95_10435 [Treponema sp.]|nr:hypothetical protein [Treponema sp.]